jgi:hypothetical protein
MTMYDQEDPLSSLDRQERAGTFVPTLSRVAGSRVYRSKR